LALAKAPNSSGIPSTARAQRRDSLSYPLVGFDPPLRFIPKASPWPLSRGQLSWDLFPLQRIRLRESTSFCLTRRRPGKKPKNPASYPLMGPNPSATVPLSGFLNLSATLFLSLPSYHFQVGGVLGVAPFRGLFLSRSPSGSSPLVYPLDVVPAGCATSVLGRSTIGHAGRHLGKTRHRVFRRLQGFNPRENRSSCQEAVNSPTADLPLLGFSPPHGLNPRGRMELSYHDRHASKPAGYLSGEPNRKQEDSCVTRLCRLRERPISHETDLPSQGFSPSIDSCRWKS
jgi:hypothetical protein